MLNLMLIWNRLQQGLSVSVFNDDKDIQMDHWKTERKHQEMIQSNTTLLFLINYIGNQELK